MKKVIWSERARKSLKEHYDYIKQDSIPAAKRVKSEIINSTKGLNVHPENINWMSITPIIQGISGGFFDGATESFIRSIERQ